MFTRKMPDNRRIQGPEESQNPLLFLKADEKAAREKKDLVIFICICCSVLFTTSFITVSTSWIQMDAERTEENQKN